MEGYTYGIIYLLEVYIYIYHGIKVLSFLQIVLYLTDAYTQTRTVPNNECIVPCNHPYSLHYNPKPLDS